MVVNPWLFRGYLLKNLPLGLLVGLQIHDLTEDRCVTSVPFKWLNKNPFKSTYFACLTMAAELSAGAMAMMASMASEESIAVLVVNVDGSFVKKATSHTYFTCEEGGRLFAAVKEAESTDHGVTTRVHSDGLDQDGNQIAHFTTTWSFKKRVKK